MYLSIKRIRYLFLKDVKDHLKHPLIVMLLIMPVFVAVLYTLMSDPSQPSESFELVSMPILMAVLFLCGMMPATSIAEEKEKGTFQMLLASPTNVKEVLMAKSILFFGLTVIICAICLFIQGLSVQPLPFALFFLLSCTFYLLLSTSIGLWSTSQVQSTSIHLPVALGLFFLATFEPLIDQRWVSSINALFPIKYAYEGLGLSIAGGNVSDYYLPLIVLSGWTVFFGIVLYLVHRHNEQKG